MGRLVGHEQSPALAGEERATWNVVCGARLRCHKGQVVTGSQDIGDIRSIGIIHVLSGVTRCLECLSCL